LFVESDLPFAVKLRLATTVTVWVEVALPCPVNALETTEVSSEEAEEFPSATTEKENF
jgi:hypothetical protein